MQDTDGKYNFFIDGDNLQSTYGLVFSQIEKDSKVLELGCFKGELLKKLNLEKNCDVIGVDILESENKSVKIINGDLNLGIPKSIKNTKYDYILLLDILEHLNHIPKLLMDDIGDISNENTEIFVSLPNINHIDVVSKIINSGFEYQNVGLLDNTHKHFYSKREIITLFWMFGFICTEIQTIVLPQNGTELYTPEFNRTSNELEKIYHTSESKVYQYVYKFKKNNLNKNISFDNYLLTFGIQNTIPIKYIENKWDIIIRTVIQDREEFLYEAIYSVCTQAYKNKELIIVIHNIYNLSTENIQEFIEKTTNKFSILIPITFLFADSQKKRGHPINIGLEYSKSQYLSFLDDDDILYPNYGEVMISRLHNSKFNFAHCKVTKSNNLFVKAKKSYYKVDSKKNSFWGKTIKKLYLVSENYIPIHSYILKRSDFEGIFFDENLDLCEDWEFLIHLIYHTNFKPILIPTDLCEYRFWNLKNNLTSSFSFQSLGNEIANQSSKYISTKYFGKKLELSYIEIFDYVNDPNRLVYLNGNPNIDDQKINIEYISEIPKKINFTELTKVEHNNVNNLKLQEIKINSRQLKFLKVYNKIEDFLRILINR